MLFQNIYSKRVMIAVKTNELKQVVATKEAPTTAGLFSFMLCIQYSGSNVSHTPAGCGYIAMSSKFFGLDKFVDR